MSTEALIPAVPLALRQASDPVKGAFRSDAEERQARERYQIIAQLLEAFSADSPQVLLDGVTVESKEMLLRSLTAQHGISRATIFRWLRAFRRGGIYALADGVRRDKGSSRWFQRYPQAQLHAAYVHGVQRRSVRVTWEAICRDHELLQVPSDDLPSYTTVGRFLQAIPEPIKLLARQGQRVYRERCAPYVSRSYGEPAGDIWVSDHMIHDVEVANDCFPEAPWLAPVRLRLTGFIDFRSRMVMGAVWCWEGSSISIASALRQAVEQYGAPVTIYCDNGKDYIKAAKGSAPPWRRYENEPPDWYDQELATLEHSGVFARLGIKTQHCIPRHPQSKHIERFFRFVHERLDQSFPTYTSGSPATRPDITEAAMMQHRKLLRMGRGEASLHPRASQFIAIALNWLDWYNREHHHTGRAMNGRTPLEAFNEFRGEPRPIPAASELTMLLLERRKCKVHECAVTLNKRRYIGSDNAAARVLHECNDREVLVGYDPLTPDDDIALFDLDGRLVGFACPEKLLEQSSRAELDIAASMQQRRQLERETRETVSGIREAARAQGAVSEVEHLAKRAVILPMAVGQVVSHRRAPVQPNTAVAPLSPDDAAALIMKEEL